MVVARYTVALLLLAISAVPFLPAEELGEMWGSAGEEAKYYPIVDIPIPPEVPMRPGSFEILPDGRLAVGTRRGDIYFIKGAFEPAPAPTYHLFASGQDEIFGLAWKDGAMTATQFGEVTRISDTDGDEVADRYDTLSNNWGYAEGHEFAFGSKHDPEGNIWVALGLSGSYKSNNLFRGWAVKVTPEGKMIPVCSGLRSPGGVGPNAEGVMFAIESQGPWNGSCSLKHLKPGGFLGHPASYNWYPFVPGMDAPAVEPDSPSRLQVEKKRVKELVPPAVRFPYIKMGRSISGFRLNQTGGKFGPFENQIFLGDYTLSVILRATTEEINGVWQGACYPFREGLATGIMHVEFSPKGQLIAGGFTTNRQWPVRGTEPFAIQRIDWSGRVPFEIREINIRKDGFLINFTKPVNPDTAARTDVYTVTTYTHNYAAGYGSPEVDQTTPKVTRAVPSADSLSVRVYLDKIVEGHIHDFDLATMKSQSGEPLLHTKAYYTVNEIPGELSQGCSMEMADHPDERKSDAARRSAILGGEFAGALSEFLADPPDLPANPESPELAALQEWLELEIAAAISKTDSNGERKIDFEVRFKNGSGVPHVFPGNMEHWKNDHPCHLIFVDERGESVTPEYWSHASVSRSEMSTQELPPGHSISVGFSGLLTAEKKLDFKSGRYDFSGLQQIRCRYHYAGICSDVETLILP